MKFTAEHRRAFAGNDISVSVCSDENESISAVSVTLDDSSLDDQALPEGSNSYSREFEQAGDAGPGKDHVLQVQAWDQDHKPHSATSQWTDPQ